MTAPGPVRALAEAARRTIDRKNARKMIYRSSRCFIQLESALDALPEDVVAHLDAVAGRIAKLETNLTEAQNQLRELQHQFTVTDTKRSHLKYRLEKTEAQRDALVEALMEIAANAACRPPEQSLLDEIKTRANAALAAAQDTEEINSG